MKKSTFELLDLLRNTSKLTDFMDKASDELMEIEPLHHYLQHIIEEKGLKRSEIIRFSGLDRGYAYDILAGKKLPSRDKVLAICFAMKLSLEETQNLLKYTGYPQLYIRVQRESVLLYALQHGLSVTDVNMLLYEMGQDCLF